MAAGVVGVDDVVSAGKGTEGGEAQGRGGEAFLLSKPKQGGTGWGEEYRLVARGDESAVEAEDLPLASAHFAESVQMQNPHSRAFAYLRKV